MTESCESCGTFKCETPGCHEAPVSSENSKENLRVYTANIEWHVYTIFNYEEVVCWLSMWRFRDRKCNKIWKAVSNVNSRKCWPCWPRSLLDFDRSQISAKTIDEEREVSTERVRVYNLRAFAYADIVGKVCAGMFECWRKIKAKFFLCFFFPEFWAI